MQAPQGFFGEDFRMSPIVKFALDLAAFLFIATVFLGGIGLVFSYFDPYFAQGAQFR